jgi:hypothetical protein
MILHVVLVPFFLSFTPCFRVVCSDALMDDYNSMDDVANCDSKLFLDRGLLLLSIEM